MLLVAVTVLLVLVFVSVTVSVTVLLLCYCLYTAAATTATVYGILYASCSFIYKFVKTTAGVERGRLFVAFRESPGSTTELFPLIIPQSVRRNPSFIIV